MHLSIRWTIGAIDAEHIAGLAAGIHTTLLNSHPESLTNDEPISLFNEWPADWNAAFSLLARGNFIVSAAQKSGAIPFVEIVSQNGGDIRLANPWHGDAVTIYRGGRKAEDLQGTVLTFATAKGEHIVVVPKGASPQPVRMM